MKATSIILDGVLLIEPDIYEDERGFFARMWDKNIFEELGLDSDLIQGNISYNKKKGTNFTRRY